MKRKYDADIMANLIDDFNKKIEPWCKENNLSLHQAFEYTREKDIEKYKILSTLWHTEAGKEYLKSCLRKKQNCQNGANKRKKKTTP